MNVPNPNRKKTVSASLPRLKKMNGSDFIIVHHRNGQWSVAKPRVVPTHDHTSRWCCE